MANSRSKLPGYFPSWPLMPSVKSLRDTLGLQSSIISGSEVALRFFEKSGQGDVGGFANFLKAQASSNGLAIGLKNFREARREAAKWYIVQIQQVFETFLKALNGEYRKYKRIGEEEWEFKDGDEFLPHYRQFLANIPKAESNTLRRTPESSLVEYYRLIRVWVVHPNEETERSAMRSFKKLVTEHASHFEKSYSFKAPNAPDEIRFDDFLLFSRAIICFSHLLNDACKLGIEEIERNFATEQRLFLRDNTRKVGRIKLGAANYFHWNHGHSNARPIKEEFANYVAQKFSNGDYFT